MSILDALASQGRLLVEAAFSFGRSEPSDVGDDQPWFALYRDAIDHLAGISMHDRSAATEGLRRLLDSAPVMLRTALRRRYRTARRLARHATREPRLGRAGEALLAEIERQENPRMNEWLDARTLRRIRRLFVSHPGLRSELGQLGRRLAGDGLGIGPDGRIVATAETPESRVGPSTGNG